MAKYLINHDLYKAFAVQTRRIAGTTKSYNLAEIGEILSKLDGTVNDVSGIHNVRAIGHDGTVLKSSYLDPGMVFACPEDAQLPDGYILTGWLSDSVIGSNYAVVEDEDITMYPLYNTISGATELITASVNYVELPILRDATSIDWGDGTVDTSSSHTYNQTGIYVIKVYGATEYFNAYLEGSDSYFTDIKFSNDVTVISYSAFSYCRSLKSVIIPPSVTSIGDLAFRSCTGLTSVTIPKGVTAIGRYAFNECSKLNSVIIPNSITDIGRGAFQYTNLSAAIYLGTEDEWANVNVGDDNGSLTKVLTFVG